MNKCAVKGCKDVGRSHICLWDGRYHGHGRIHYDGGAGQKDAKIAGLTYRKGDWYLMCNAHYEALKLAREQRTEHCFIVDFLHLLSALLKEILTEGKGEK